MGVIGLVGPTCDCLWASSVVCVDPTGGLLWVPPMVVMDPTCGCWWDQIAVWSLTFSLITLWSLSSVSCDFLILRGVLCNLPSILLYVGPRDTIELFFTAAGSRAYAGG